MAMPINDRWNDAEISIALGRFARPERMLSWPLSGRDFYAWRGVPAMVDITAIRGGNYLHHPSINPFGIVAATGDADWSATRGRGRFVPARVALLSEREVEGATGTRQPCAGVNAWTG